MSPPEDPAEGFDNILNFRDVGETVNEFLGKKHVKTGLLFRSARLDDATLHDRQRLTDEYGIRSVMDLRTKTEHLNQAKKRDADLKIPGLLQSNAALAEPVQIPGLIYREIGLTGKNFERALINQLSWWSYFKLIFLFIFGFRMQAIAIIGREVMLPRGLVGLGLDTIDHSGPEIAEVINQSHSSPAPFILTPTKALNSFLEPSGLPTLVHCTQGKDRTGIIISLVLMILDVPLKAIDFDYKLTDGTLLPEKEGRLKEIREIGLTDDFFETSPELIERQAKHLEDKYGGLNVYLDGNGFTESQRGQLRERLLY